MDFNEAFEKANQTIHRVEDQWHYTILTKFGFQPDDLTGIGFVRAYMYTNKEIGLTIRAATGASCDHWQAFNTEHKAIMFGYWRELEPYLVGLDK